MASPQDQLELLKIYQSNQDKYIYFLLAASAACIALVIQLTTGKPLQCHHLILGAAIILWGASFWAGCRQLYWVQVCLASNYQLLQLDAGNHSKQPSTSHELEIAINETNKAIQINTEKADYYSKWQFRLIVAGAVVFISWHIYGMYIIGIWQGY